MARGVSTEFILRMLNMFENGILVDGFYYSKRVDWKVEDAGANYEIFMKQEVLGEDYWFISFTIPKRTRNDRSTWTVHKFY